MNVQVVDDDEWPSVQRAKYVAGERFQGAVSSAPKRPGSARLTTTPKR
jgi:hypothetical protein